MRSRKSGSNYRTGSKSVKSKPRLNTTPAGQLACANGENWLGEHPICEAQTSQDCKEEVARVDIVKPPSTNAIDPVDGVVEK